MPKTIEELSEELKKEKEKNEETKKKNEENIKNLQKKLTEKDLEVKKKEEELKAKKKPEEKKSKEDEKMNEMNETIKNLDKTIKEIKTKDEKAELSQKFPDILPDLLLGKNEEEQEVIVKKQRDLMEKEHGEFPSAHGQIYKNENEIDKAIEKVKENKSLETEEKLVQIRQLKNEKNNLT